MPASIHRIAVHRPVGARPTRGRSGAAGDGKALGDGTGVVDGTGVGAGVATAVGASLRAGPDDVEAAGGSTAPVTFPAGTDEEPGAGVGVAGAGSGPQAATPAIARMIATPDARLSRRRRLVPPRILTSVPSPVGGLPTWPPADGARRELVTDRFAP
jgi:hypothetical protein